MDARPSPAGGLTSPLRQDTQGCADLSTRFGAAITRLVLALTDAEHIADHDQRQAAAREQAAAAGEEALMILAADKISKIRELKLEIEQLPDALTHHAPLAGAAH